MEVYHPMHKERRVAVCGQQQSRVEPAEGLRQSHRKQWDYDQTQEVRSGPGGEVIAVIKNQE